MENDFLDNCKHAMLECSTCGEVHLCPSTSEKDKEIERLEAVINEFVIKNDFAGLLNTHFVRADVYKILEAKVKELENLLRKMCHIDELVARDQRISELSAHLKVCLRSLNTIDLILCNENRDSIKKTIKFSLTYNQKFLERMEAEREVIEAANHFTKYLHFGHGCGEKCTMLCSDVNFFKDALKKLEESK